MPLNKKHFAFTVQIPAFKRINFDDKYVTFKSLSSLDQETFLYGLVRDVTQLMREDKPISYDIHFESHQDGRRHCHGTIYDIDSEQIDYFKKGIARVIGVKTEKQINECCFCIPQFFDKGWEAYKTKHQISETDEIDFSIYQFGKNK